MRGKNKVAIGFMAVMAITGMIEVSSSLASDMGHVVVEERIGHGGSIYHSQSAPAGTCQRKVEVTERIGSGGSTYSSSQTAGCQAGRNERRNVHVTERIGAGGSTYFASEPTS